jgi:hypothetical protein
MDLLQYATPHDISDVNVTILPTCLFCFGN